MSNLDNIPLIILIFNIIFDSTKKLDSPWPHKAVKHLNYTALMWYIIAVYRNLTIFDSTVPTVKEKRSWLILLLIERHLFWVSFTHLHLSYTSCSHCSAATQTQQSWQRTDPTWWCPWCWGCSATAPETDVRRMRMCWKSRRAAGQSWWAWWLAWRCRWTWGDHSLLLGSRFHSVWLKKKKQWQWNPNTRNAVSLSLKQQNPPVVTESVIVEWKGLNSLIFKVVFVLKGKSQILTQSFELRGGNRLLRVKQSTSTKAHLTEVYIETTEHVPL